VKNGIPSSIIPRVTALTLFLTLELAGIGPSQAQERGSPPTQQSMGSRKSYIGLPNFGEVSPNLFRGGQPGVDGLEALKKMGVSIVVDMRGSRSSHEETAVTKLGMQYVSLPWHCPFPKDEPFARFLRLVQDNPRKKIFVHCRLGDDRTGMAVASYRMGIQGWSADDAMNEMKMFGFSPIHHAICPTLASYEREFPKRLKSDPAFKDLRTPAAGAK
jgi:tyrosine-protein phosphatase SIW14